MSVDEIDTILITREHDRRQARQHTRDKSQFHSKITYKWTEINKEKKFSTFEIVTSFLPYRETHFHKRNRPLIDRVMRKQTTLVTSAFRSTW